MATPHYVNTASDTTYGVEASNGTMAILRQGQGTKVLIIHRRFKNLEIRQDGPPGK